MFSFIKRVRSRVREIKELEELVRLLFSSHTDLYTTLIAKNKIISRLASERDSAGAQARAAKTRANKFACLALLGFGLIAIELHGLALFFLPR